MMNWGEADEKWWETFQLPTLQLLLGRVILSQLGAFPQLFGRGGTKKILGFATGHDVNGKSEKRYSPKWWSDSDLPWYRVKSHIIIQTEVVGLGQIFLEQWQKWLNPKDPVIPSVRIGVSLNPQAHISWGSALLGSKPTPILTFDISGGWLECLGPKLSWWLNYSSPKSVFVKMGLSSSKQMFKICHMASSQSDRKWFAIFFQIGVKPLPNIICEMNHEHIKFWLLKVPGSWIFFKQNLFLLPPKNCWTSIQTKKKRSKTFSHLGSIL